jgi:hypothetical protein
MDDDAHIARLRSLIGKRFEYQDRRWILIEILADERIVVLRGTTGESPIQVDQFGHPARRTTDTLSLPMLAPDGDNLSDELMLLLTHPLRE